MIDIDSEDDFPSLPTSPPTPSDSYMNCPTIFHSTIITGDDSRVSVAKTDVDVSPILEETEILEKDTCKDVENISPQDESTLCYGKDTESSNLPESEKYETLNGNFLSTDQLIEILTTDYKTMITEIPNTKLFNRQF